MTTAADYTTVDDGDLIYPTLLLEDADGNRLTPSAVSFYLRIGDATESIYYAAVRVEDGFYRVTIDTTGMAGDKGNWLWGQWLTTLPAQTSESWQAYVNTRAA